MRITGSRPCVAITEVRSDPSRGRHRHALTPHAIPCWLPVLSRCSHKCKRTERASKMAPFGGEEGAGQLQLKMRPPVQSAPWSAVSSCYLWQEPFCTCKPGLSPTEEAFRLLYAPGRGRHI